MTHRAREHVGDSRENGSNQGLEYHLDFPSIIEFLSVLASPSCSLSTNLLCFRHKESRNDGWHFWFTRD